MRERDGRTVVAAAQLADAAEDAPPFDRSLFGGAREAEEEPPHTAEEADAGGEPPGEAEPQPEDAPEPAAATVVATLRPSGDEEADRRLVRTLLGRECPGGDELRLHVEDGERVVALRVARGVDGSVFAPWAAREIGEHGSVAVLRGRPDEPEADAAAA